MFNALSRSGPVLACDALFMHLLTVKTCCWALVVACLAVVTGWAQQPRYLGHDLRLFRGEAWALARAVHRQDTARIRQLVARRKVPVDYREPTFGQTLLKWAVMTDRYESAQALLKSGADPNRQSTNGTSPLMEAADQDETARFVRLLLQHGGDPNTESQAREPNRLATPLIAAAAKNPESVRLLVAAGADLNHVTKHGQSALEVALMMKQVATVRYLLVEQQAAYDEAFVKRHGPNKWRAANMLRYWRFPLDSDLYRQKMELVAFLQARGQNYWDTPIPEHYFKLYPKEYLDRY